MGTRMIEQPYCDADREDVKEVKTFTWTEDDGTSYRVQLGAGEHACYGSLMTVLDHVRPYATRHDAEVEVTASISNELDPDALAPAADEGEPVGEDKREPVPTAGEAGSRSSSDMHPEEKAECRQWWRRKFRAEKLPEPPATNKGQIPREVVAAWDRHKAKLSGKEPAHA